MKSSVEKVIIYFSLIILINSSYIYEALHNSENKFDQIMICNTTEVETRIIYNDDFQKNMTQKFVKGNTTMQKKNPQIQIGWNTSSYLGLFQTSQDYVVEFCNIIVFDQKIGLIEIQFNMLLVEPIVNTTLKIENLIISMGLKTMCLINNNKFESVIQRKKILSSKITYMGQIMKGFQDQNKMADEYQISIKIYNDDKNYFFLKILPEFSQIAKYWAINNFLAEFIETCDLDCFNFNLKNQIIGKYGLDYSCQTNNKYIESIDEFKTSCMYCSKNINNNPKNLPSCYCSIDEQQIIFYPYSIQSHFNDWFDIMQNRCIQKSALQKKQFPSKRLQALWYYFQNSIFNYRIQNNYDYDYNIDNITLKGEIIQKKNISELPLDFFVDQEELVVCNLQMYNTDNPIIAFSNILLLSCLGIQNLSSQNQSQIFDEIYKNRYKDMSEILVKWQSYLQKIELTIPFKQVNQQKGKTMSSSIQILMYSERFQQFEVFYEYQTISVYNFDNNYFPEYIVPEQSTISINLDGYFFNQLQLNYYICEDSTCQRQKRIESFEILNMNYMKIFITNPDLEGRIYIDEMTYTLFSENHSTERFVIPQIQRFHPFQKSELIVGFICNSGIDQDIMKYNIQASYQPSEIEIQNSRLLQRIEIPQQTQKYFMIKKEIVEEEEEFE